MDARKRAYGGKPGAAVRSPGSPLSRGRTDVAARTPLPRVLAVNMGEHGRQITCAGDRLGRHRLRDAREVGGRERYVERAERFLELIAAARADQRHDVLAARADPGEGELRGRGVLLARDRAERAHERHVARKVFG